MPIWLELRRALLANYGTTVREIDMTDAIRPLIAGNWKMNGLKSSMAEFEAMMAGAGALAGKADLLVCPPATLIAGFRRQGAAVRKRRGRRPGLPPKCLGRPYRRSLGGNAGGCRRQRHHRRPFRAARRPWRERCAGAAEGGSRLARGARRNRLHRRDPSAARCRADAGYLRRRSSRVRCRMVRQRPIWWWPMSRSGRSAPG